MSLFMIVMWGMAFLSSWSAVIIRRSIFVISYTSKAGVFWKAGPVPVVRVWVDQG